mmetsp:Transcript_70874/g.196901  ORF Transcript_70874/g.196901 Transcript_70874/m.196901 type:complete len:348 (-) Transcript_70874:140-1183(-)
MASDRETELNDFAPMGFDVSPVDHASADSLAEPLKVTMGSGAKEAEPPALNTEELKQENAALSRKNAQLQEQMALAQENAALYQENARLVAQNALLRMQPPTGPYPPAGMWWPDPWTMQAYGALPGAYGSHGMQMQNPSRGRAKSGGSDMKTKSISSFRSSVSGSDFQSQGTRGSVTSIRSDGASEAGDNDAPCAPATNEGPPTTVMMRNIPNNYTRELLLELINEHGFENCYDLVYLPVDFKSEVGLGYAFINLTTSQEAERFRWHFQGFRNWSVLSEKVCEVSWSDVLQGIGSHVERYRNSPVMHESVPDEWKPAIFKEGKRVPFPVPTKKIRAPRPWARRQEAA